MDAPAPVHLKEMYKVIRHMLSTKGYGLKFELRKDMIKWALKACRILGLTALNSLLQYVNWLVWEVCSVN